MSPSSGETVVTRRWVFATIGLAAGFSGLAVVFTILTGVPLSIAEAALVVVPLTAVVVVSRRVPRDVVQEVWRVARAGVIGGFAATLIYDVTRTALSIFDPSPYNPFEAIRQFGLAMLPAGTGPLWVMTAGLVVHFVNGSSFGVIYATFAGRHVKTLRPAALSGLAWGLTLEFLQSILYPGWLRMATVLREFLVISAIGHIAYGLALGLGVHWLLQPRQGESSGSAAQLKDSSA